MFVTQYLFSCDNWTQLFKIIIIMWSVSTEAPSGAGLRHLVYGLNPMIAALRERGIRVEPLLRESGINRKLLNNPESQLAPDKELTFWTLAVEALGGGPIGLELGQRYHCSSYGVLGLAILTSLNLKQAIETVFENVMMTWTFFTLTAATERGEARFSFVRERDLGTIFRCMSDRGLSAAYTMFCEALGERFPLNSVHLMYEHSEDRQRYEDWFCCPVKFGQAHNTLYFDEDWLYRRLPQAEESSHRIFSAQCRKVSRSLAAQVRFSEIIRYNLLEELSRFSYLENMADKLELTPRTIQRKLAKEQTSFKKLVEEVRRNLSLEYLTETRLPVGDIADRLGYRDSAGFSHAFTRWVGKSPTDFRSQVHSLSYPDRLGRADDQ